MSAPSSTRIRPVPPEPEPSKPPGCEQCRAYAKERKELRAQVRDLQEQNARLVRAVQREAHFIENGPTRSVHDGKRRQ